MRMSPTADAALAMRSRARALTPHPWGDSAQCQISPKSFGPLAQLVPISNTMAVPYLT